LFGQAFDYQQSVPFYSLFTATLHADPPVGDADALRRLGASADLRYWVVHDLRAAIRAAAAQQPLAILLEDIHWADNATLLALRSLATQADAPVAWVLTARSGAGGAVAHETLAALRRAGATFVQLTALSPAAGLAEAAGAIVRVAATLPDRFSAALLAAVLDRSAASLMSGIQEAVRADLLIDDGEQLRFRHDLLREATLQSLPSSLRRAMERQSAAVMLDMGAAPAEVATQLARSAEVGDQAAVAELRRAAHFVANSDPSAAADLSVRALELLPAEDRQRGPLTAETVELLNRADRYGEAEELADAALAAEVLPEEEAEIRLRRAAVIKETIERRVDENRRALQLSHVSQLTRARHQTWLAYNLAMNGEHDQARAAAEQAVAAGDADGDVESRILRETTLAVLDAIDGYAQSAIQRMDELDAVARDGSTTLAHELCAMHKGSLLSFVGRFDDAAAAIADGTEKAQRDHAGMPLHLWRATGAIVHLAAGQLAASRAEAEAPFPLDATGWSPANAVRTVVLTEVAAHIGDRNLFHEMVNDAHSASSSESPAVRWAAASVLARAAWERSDFDEAARWLGGKMAPLITPVWAWLAPAHLIFVTRVAAAAGDAGLRASVLQGVELLEREQPAPIEQFNAAFDCYVDQGAYGDGRRVARALRGLGVERRIARQPRAKTGWGSLTDAELKVMSLVADGATNAVVAQRLRLSPHTVKTHIRNAFAKLDIHSRVQLTDVMGDSDDPSRE
jgi:DNA-binding CsgD family transcriptional regulator